MSSSGRVILLEGVCGSGKTTLSGHLRRQLHPPPATFTQRETYGPIVPFEDAGTLDDARNREFLLETSARIAKAVEDRRMVLVDTLHVTQRVRPGFLSETSFLKVDAELAGIPTLVVLLVIDRDTIRRRTIAGRRGTRFARYCQRFGRTEDELVDHFAWEQDSMVSLLAEKSRLPTVTLSGVVPVERLRRQVRAALDGLPSSL